MERYLAKRFWKMLSSEEVPSFETKTCLNKKYKGFGCQACVQSCPAKAIDLKTYQLNSDVCTNCLGCVSVCPSRSFIPTPGMVDIQLEQLKHQQELSISCVKSQLSANAQVECLAHLPLELLALYCLNGPLILNHGDCSKCVQENLVTKRLEDLQHLFNDDLKLSFNQETSIDISKRELFALMKLKSSKFALNLLVNPETINNRFFYLDLFLKILPSDRILNFNQVKVNENCWGCGHCAKTCPNQAIKLEQVDNQMYFIHDHQRCTHCGLCLKVCHEQALSYHYLKVDKEQPSLKYLLDVRFCSKCAQPIAKDEQDPCILCVRGG